MLAFFKITKLFELFFKKKELVWMTLGKLCILGLHNFG